MPIYILHKKDRKEIIMTGVEMGGFSYKEYSLGKKGQVGGSELSGEALKNDKKGVVDVSDGLSKNELEKIDANKDGFITYSEYKNYLQTADSSTYDENKINEYWSQLQSNMGATTGSVSGEADISKYTEQTLDDGRMLKTYYDVNNNPVKKEIKTRTNSLVKTDTYNYNTSGEIESRTLVKEHINTGKVEVTQYNGSNVKISQDITFYHENEQSINKKYGPDIDRSIHRKYDPTTGHITDKYETRADGSSINSIYDPTTGKINRKIETKADESIIDKIYDPTTGKIKEKIETKADGSNIDKIYDPTTGNLIEKDKDNNVIKYINNTPTEDNVSKIIYDTKTHTVTKYDINGRRSEVEKYPDDTPFSLTEKNGGIDFWPGDDEDIWPTKYIYETDNTITMSSFDWFLGRTTETNYDADDESKINSVTVKDSAGNTISNKQYEYNTNGSIKRMTEEKGDGTTTEYEYTTNGSIKRMTEKKEDGTTTEYKFSSYTKINGERVPKKVKIGEQTYSIAYLPNMNIASPKELAGKNFSEI